MQLGRRCGIKGLSPDGDPVQVYSSPLLRRKDATMAGVRSMATNANPITRSGILVTLQTRLNRLISFEMAAAIRECEPPCLSAN